jgi:RNA polymerase sigma-70 factor (ECF subfamily)
MEDIDVHTKLVNQLCEGSKDAFTKLYMIYSDPLYGFVLKLTKSPTEAENILQETFMRVWDNRAKISLDYSFKSYLFKISYHLIIDSFRKQIDSVGLEDYISSGYHQETTEAEADQKLNLDDYNHLIAKSLNKHTSYRQKIFQMSREEGLSAKEIGKILGISEKTVNNQLSFILARLREDILMFSCIVLLNILF